MKSYTILQLYKCRGNKTWYGRIAENGEFRYVSLKTRSKADAQAWLAAKNAERFLPESIRASLDPKDKSIDDALRQYLDSVSATKGPSSRTYETYRYRLKPFTDWLGNRGVERFRKFTPGLADEFSTWLAVSYAPKTHREIIKCADQFCKWSARIFDLAGYDPFFAVQLPKLVKRAPAFWKEEEVDAILDQAPSPEWRLFWAVMAFAGLRHAEACRFDCCSIVDGRIRVVGKGNREDFLPISERLQIELNRYGEIEDGIFYTAKFRKSDRSNDVLRLAAERAGASLLHATNHKFRHSFASNMVRSIADGSGINLAHVQRLMRHQDIRETIDTYGHLLPEDLLAAVNAKKKSPPL